ncbi:Lipoprotein-anchoring transpeptidase ErfK/SrfK [Frankineae bacterium MT45]|nr:Lipoprotein-anchoring transpeptidase ErfK/SrfK [Frankineae bacterium MT45]
MSGRQGELPPNRAKGISRALGSSRQTKAGRFGILVAAGLALSLALAACGGSSGPSTQSSSPTTAPSTAVSASPSDTSPAATTAAATPTPSPKPVTAQTVHIRLLNSDGATYGVGMPIVAYFSSKITDGNAFAAATVVKVNGAVNHGSWYFEASSINAGYPIEAHYRPAPTPGVANQFWPANASITMNMATQGVSAGAGLAFDDSLTLSMATGDAHISYVNCATERMVVKSNGVAVRTPMLTSCGAPITPTANGIKVVQQLGESAPGTDKLRPNGAVRMVGGGGLLGNYDLIVPWSVRLTNGGEFVHAAAWNGRNIGARSTSDGCTNLNTPDAKWFYNFSRIGDVVIYTNTGGPAMKPYDGFGEWNLPTSSFNNSPAAA